MMHSVFLFLMLFQGPGPHYQDPNSTRQCPRQAPSDRWAAVEAEFEAQHMGGFHAQARDAAYEEREFLQKYNQLVKALVDFSVTYNSQHAVDVKKVKAIQKAWRQLERMDWFKTRDK